MRWPGVLALLGACEGNEPAVQAGDVSLVLDIPNGVLDPRGYTSVEVILHAPPPLGDVVRSARVTDGAFDLGTIDPSMVSVEATLRNDSGAAVGYGRTAIAATFAGGSKVVVPVRRPIGYIAGTVSRGVGTGPTPVLQWTGSPATFSDLSVGASPGGRTQIGSQAVLMIAAGSNLYLVTQATSDPSGVLTGPAKLLPVSTADHQVGAALAGQLTGAVIDGAGSDDGSALAIGTTTQLFAVDTAAGTARPLAAGTFARVAILTAATGEIDAVAIKNLGAPTGTCSTSAELWWAPLTAGAGAAHRVAVGGFTDVATDRGRAYYVDACKGELGEVTATATMTPRRIPGTGAGMARPTALAVSNGQAYVGLETQPATTSLLVASVTTTGMDEPRVLWSETAQQVVHAIGYDGVQRQLDARSVVVGHLEVGAGGDYLALTTSAHFYGGPVVDAHFPDITIDTEELRMFDASTGGVVQRYRSWCAGAVRSTLGDLGPWECASTAGQTAATADRYEHHIHSMTFLFGKK
jgi:hypothetical protein